MFAYNDDQLSQIRALVTNGNFPAAYRLAASFASGGEGVSQASILWMQGAAQINENVGSEAAFVRQYTAAQFEVRFGVALDQTLIQNVSNTIAARVLAEILRTGTVPSIDTIALEDALPAATQIFRGDPGGWAGNPLFLFLGHSTAFTNNILEVQGDTYDALAMIKYLGATGSWASNLTNAFSATMGTGSQTTILAGASQVDTFLRAAYGGIGTSFQVLSSQVVLGRVDTGSTLNGLSSGEFMRGGGFDDTLKSSAGADVMDGGGGRDIADYSNASGRIEVTVKFEQSTANYTAGVTGSAGIDALFGIEEIIGSNSDDMFLLRSFPTLTGQLTLDGAGGADQLSAFYLPNVTIDIVNGSLASGDNTIAIKNFEKFEGTNGGDTFVLVGNEESVDGRGGADTVDYSNAMQGVNFQGQAVKLKNIENIVATRFDDEIDADAVLNATGSGSGSAGGLDNTIYGLAGKDKLSGGAGADKLFGGDDDDELLDGGAGNDEVYGERGNDKLYGGADDDKLFGGADDDKLSGGTGNDKLFGGTGKDRLTGGVGGDQFYVGAGDIVQDSDSTDRLFVGDDASEDEADYSEVTQPELPQVSGIYEYSDLEGNYLEGYNYFYVDDSRVINTGRSLVILTGSADGIVAKDYQSGDFGLDILTPAQSAAKAYEDYEAKRNGWSSERFILTPYLDTLRTALALEKQADQANREGRSDFLQVLETPTQIAGTQGIDFLQGTAGDDEIVGGGEMDLLLGGAGSDIYRYAAGDGADYIMDYDGDADDVDVLTFDDLNIGDIELSGGGTDLYINVLGTQRSTITIVGQFAEAGLEGIEEIHFANGTVLNRGQILEALQTVRGSAGDDELYVKAQQINGEWQPTVFVGGRGNDHLHGGENGDTYVYAKGDGNDTIEDFADGIGTLRLSDLNPDDIRVSRLPDNSIVITIGDTGETITVKPYSNQTLGFDQIAFANGTVWNRDDILAATRGPTGATLTGDAIVENAVNGTVVGTVAGVDPDADAVLTYTLRNDAGGRFAIDAATGQITVANGALLDYEGAASHSVIVRVTDQGGFSFDKSFNLNVTDVNEAPTGAALTGGSVAENAANGTVVGTVAGVDPDAGATLTYALTDNAGGRFAIDANTGQITVANGTLLDYETATSHGVRVRIIDQGGLTFDMALTINVTNVAGPTLTGTSGNDVLFGTREEDTINGGDGTDSIYGDDGNDFIDGGAGDDDLSGGGGNDVIIGGAGNDFIDGGDGADLIIGGAGDDDLSGGAGNDYITGGNGNDFIDGGIGNDTIIGDAGDDALHGRDGNDVLIGGTGTNLLDGGAGNDTASYTTATTGVTADLTAPANNSGDAGGDTYLDVENLTGSAFADHLKGDENANVIDGAGGNDTFTGAGGNDTFVFYADFGQDTITDFGVGDTIEFRNGFAAIQAATHQVGDDVHIDIDASNSIVLTNVSLSTLNFAFTYKISVLNHAPTDATLSGGLIAENSSWGTIVGTVSGIDPDARGTLRYSLIENAEGRFAINATSGLITVSGSLDYESAQSYAITVRVTDQGGLTFDKALTINVTNVVGSTLTGTSGNDALSGTREEDTINGDNGDDILIGGSGGDGLSGGAGVDTASYATATTGVAASLVAPGSNTGDAAGDSYSDIENLTGSGFADTLAGDGNANTIDGGAGNDLLTGGAGGDTFVFRSNLGQDVITDFTTGSDILEFRDGIFVDVAAALGAATASGDDTLITIDADNSVLLKNVTFSNLHAGDFHIV